MLPTFSFLEGQRGDISLQLSSGCVKQDNTASHEFDDNGRLGKSLCKGRLKLLIKVI